ncbi:MetQ/NlpA family ABC transporter substrate-binding protein [Paenibacillus macerans]|uniref:Lipoprotein n=1 Tax=Paenibacillus macerans TaxID=44252 RepID=A0A090ZID6_PAEMA|nr:MetQ/NlpA family ABC transporter substrate-binding protein [Paenibacillus macerans]KFN10402.1 lipo, YaeC family protein [Paenibacillus macerans]MCY7557427.1 MetQ/NlpA family ABC transporter substrate-binding protein [Paenibacillus macerans]MEC0151690.1 MetQ/NlpA family ABC transporter substrate-binding protein [Paenibacillus macerans]SUD26368.1 Outer membrane lipoprotein 2 [Paenibacillus macerans]
MKKWTLSLLTLALVLVLSACGSNNAANNGAGSAAGGNAGTTNAGAAEGSSESGDTNTAAEPVKLVVGATVPHADILRFIAPKLKEEGVELEVKEFTDYVQPNVQLYEQELDANYFQHQPYLDEQNKQNGFDLVPVVGVHVEPFGAYSNKYKSADEIPDGAKVAIPNDPTNGGRALLLLQKQGLIKLKDDAGISATAKDITENPKNLQFKEVDAAILPRQLPEVDLALINTNYALEADLNPTKDALFIEDKDSPYTNILVARPDNKNSDAIQKLAKALTSDEVRTFINDTYKGALVPVF